MKSAKFIKKAQFIQGLTFEEEGVVYQLPEHGNCFVCGSENSRGIGLVWYIKGGVAPASLERDRAGLPNVLIFSEFSFGLAEQGPPDHAHGGASAAVIDEAMGNVVWCSQLAVVLANINLDYRLPVPLGTPVRVEAWVDKIVGRKAYAVGQIVLPEGQVAVAGTGLYVQAPQLFPGLS